MLPTFTHSDSNRHLSDGHAVATNVLDSLAGTSAAFLSSSAPLTADHRLPPFVPSTISPVQRGKYSQLLKEAPKTYREAALHDAIQDYEVREAEYKQWLLEMQSTVLLVKMFSDRLHGHLAAQQERQKKKKTGHLNADGLPKLLMGDEFYKRIEDHENTTYTDALAREARKKQREERSAALATWKQAENEWREQNAARRESHRDMMKLWAEEAARAKQEGRQADLKPKLGKLEGPIPKPKVNTGEVEEMELDGSMSDGEGNESDGGSAEA